MITAARGLRARPLSALSHKTVRVISGSVVVELDKLPGVTYAEQTRLVSTTATATLT
jgi:hypothetical protein